MTVSFEVDRHDFANTRLFESDVALSPGQVRARIDHFALTSNNVTYATIGEALGYWNFFPAEPGWGRVPAFGFAEIEASLCPDVAVGARVYGYWPMASHVTMLPGRATHKGFHDMSAHRASMADVYNSYSYTEADPLYLADREAQQMLLLPLFFTAFVVDDLLADSAMFGADSVILSSASSKTAIATAHLLAARESIEVVALTSGRNSEFVSSLGCYDHVATYDTVDDIERKPSIYADFSGSPTIRSDVHRHFSDLLRYSSLIGGTHWNEVGGTVDIPDTHGVTPEFFFAPSQIAKRTAEWGRDQLEQRMGEAWNRFSAWSDTWLHVVEHHGPEHLEALWSKMLAGQADPREGHVAGITPIGSSTNTAPDTAEGAV